MCPKVDIHGLWQKQVWGAIVWIPTFKASANILYLFQSRARWLKKKREAEFYSIIILIKVNRTWIIWDFRIKVKLIQKFSHFKLLWNCIFNDNTLSQSISAFSLNLILKAYWIVLVEKSYKISMLININSIQNSEVRLH